MLSKVFPAVFLAVISILSWKEGWVIRMKEREKRLEVDRETGEVKEFIEWREGDQIRSAEQLAAIRDYYQKREDQTDFIWVLFDYCKPFAVGMKPGSIARMVCLATYINDSGFAMYKADVRDMLGLNPNLSLELRKDLEDKKIITLRKDKIYFSKTCFYRGEMQRVKRNHIRLFTEATRALYNELKPSAHKWLSVVFQMLPYANRQTNILSINQEEQDIARVEKMTIQEFCALVNYDVKHAARLRKELLQLRVNGRLAVGFFDNKDQLDPKGKFIIINPHLLYGGERFGETYQHICALFEEESRNFHS